MALIDLYLATIQPHNDKGSIQKALPSFNSPYPNSIPDYLRRLSCFIVLPVMILIRFFGDPIKKLLPIFAQIELEHNTPA